MKKHSPVKKLLVICLTMLIVSGLIGMIYAVIDFTVLNKNDRFASKSIEFTYEGAANGLTPTGEVFAIDGIENDVIIREVLEKLGYQDKYSIEAVKESILIKASFPSDVIDRIQQYNSLYDYSASRDVQQENYFPTIFTVCLYDGFDKSISKSGLEQMLNTLIDSYRSHFLSENVYVFDKDAFDNIITINDADYRYQIEILKQQITTLKTYSRELYDANIAFKYNGVNFNDLSLKCQAIEDNDLSGLEALIILNSYSKSPSRIRSQFQYQINLWNNELEQKKANLEQIDNLIANYQMDDILYVPVGDSYIRVDSNSTAVYEELTDQKQELTSRITVLNSNIKTYKQYIDDLNIGTAAGDSTDDLVDKIKAVNNKLTAVKDEFIQMVKAYNDSVITEDNIILGSTDYTSPSLFSFSFIKRIIKCAAPVCLSALLVFCGYMIFHEIGAVKRHEAF